MTKPTANPRAGPGMTMCMLGAVYVGALLLATGCGRDEPGEAAPATSETSASSMAHHEDDTHTRQTSADRSGMAELVTASRSLKPSPKPTEALPADATCITPACHAGLVDAKHIHGPVAVANCQSCHGEDAGGHNYPLLRPANETCTFCHPVLGARSHEHAAIEAGCTSCHDPHSSDTKFLMNQPSIEQVCASCHDTPLKKFAHGPFASGQCTVCHQPHEANAPSLLRQGDQPEHCFSCHTGVQVRLANSPFVHEPAKQDCTTCHDAHTSDFPLQLSAAVPDTCFACHGEMAQRIEAQPVSHDAVFMEQGCANCHDPHAAAGPNMLRDRADHLCLQCHNEPVIANDDRTIPDMSDTLKRRFLHGPVRAGDCAACHTVHGGENARLLVQRFPDTFYASFDLANYALCFSCHSQDLVLTERTDQLTGFREGDQNLHYLHVHRDEKGRTCKTCHDIHGSDRPDHIASSVPFEGSQWAMPINFSKTDNGGSCSPGCHETKTYNRTPHGTAGPVELTPTPEGSS